MLRRAIVSLRDATETEGHSTQTLSVNDSVIVSVRVGPRLKGSGARPKTSARTPNSTGLVGAERRKLCSSRGAQACREHD